MRNVFDQYKQPENRLTHALVSSLSEDSNLLKNFVRWIAGTTAQITVTDDGGGSITHASRENPQRTLRHSCIPVVCDAKLPARVGDQPAFVPGPDFPPGSRMLDEESRALSTRK